MTANTIRLALVVTTLVVVAAGIFTLDAVPEYASWYFAIALLESLALAVAAFGRSSRVPELVLAISLVAAGLAGWHAVVVVDRLFFGISVLLVALPCVVAVALALRWVRATSAGRSSLSAD